MLTLSAYKGFLAFSLLLVLLSAAADGFVETITHHYSSFQDRFPSANPYWWNPARSWDNKEAGLWAGTVEVIGSDAYHLFRFVSRVLLFGAAYSLGNLSPAAYSESRMFGRFALATLASVAVAWWLGFYFVYALLF